MTQEKGSMDAIIAHRKQFYETLQGFFDKNPASPKLTAALLSEAAGYALAVAPEDKKETFRGYAHATLDKAMAQRETDMNVAQ